MQLLLRKILLIFAALVAIVVCFLSVDLLLKNLHLHYDLHLHGNQTLSVIQTNYKCLTANPIELRPWHSWPRRRPQDPWRLPPLLPPSWLSRTPGRSNPRFAEHDQEHSGQKQKSVYTANFPVAALPEGKLSSTVNLLVLVKSAVENRNLRRDIRNTWGDHRFWPSGYLLRFMVGSPADSAAMTQLFDECRNFGDVIIHGEDDGYRNNTLKMLAALSWADRHLPEAAAAAAAAATRPLVVLSDDDLLVNPFLAAPFLQQIAHRSNLGDYLAGNCVTGSSPVRQAGSKWSIAEADYPPGRYPDYLSAGWLLIPRRLLKPLLWAAKRVTPRLPFDDVYLGLLAAKLRLELVCLTGLLDLTADNGTDRACSRGAESARPSSVLAKHGYATGAASAAGSRTINVKLMRDWTSLVRLYCSPVS